MNITPDYFHVCATNWYAQIPTNAGGYQQPKNINDSAYSGITTLPDNNNVHEILGISLLDTLTIGQVYYISFFVSAGYKDTLAFRFKCFCNRIGAKFLTYNPPSVNNPFNFQLINDSANFYTDTIVNDTANWIKIKGSFIADSAYTFIMIGNFFTEDSISYTCIDTLFGKRTHTFIDEVCVSTDSATCFSLTGIEQNNINNQNLIITPNPVINELTIKFNERTTGKKEINIYNNLGQNIYRKTLSSTELKINCSSWANGIYLIKCSNNIYKILINKL